MERIRVEKVIQTRWKDTIKKIEKGQYADFEATAEDGNKARVAASELNKKHGSNYSISIAGNIITVKHE